MITIRSALVCLAAAGAAGSAQACEEVRFDAGVGQVSGFVNADRTDCYVLAMDAGQSLSVEVVDGLPLFAVTGHNNLFDSLTFTTDRERTYVDVATMMVEGGEDYSLVFTIN